MTVAHRSEQFSDCVEPAQIERTNIGPLPDSPVAVGNSSVQEAELANSPQRYAPEKELPHQLIHLP